MSDEADQASDREQSARDAAQRPCPDCPDGSVWNSQGPTAKVCPVCNGHAVVKLDGSPVAPPYKSKFESTEREDV